MLKVEHIGIAVKTLSESIPLFEKLLNSQCYKTEVVETEKVSTAFFKTKIQKLNYWKALTKMGSSQSLLKKRRRATPHCI